MATYITVGQGPDPRLLRENSKQTQANRQQLEDIPRFRDPEVQRLLNEGYDVIRGRHRSRLKDEELAASRRKGGISVGHVWWSPFSATTSMPAFYTNVENSQRLRMYTQYSVGYYTQYGWNVTSDNLQDTLNYTYNVPSPNIPSSNFSYSVAPLTGLCEVTTYVERRYRAGYTTNNQGFTYELGTRTVVYAEPLYIGTPADYDFSSIDGLGTTVDEDWAYVDANGEPPLPPNHGYSNVYIDEVSRSSTQGMFPRNNYDIFSWSASALTTVASSQFSKHIVLPISKKTCILIVVSRYGHVYAYNNLDGTINEYNPANWVSYPSGLYPLEFLASDAYTWPLASFDGASVVSSLNNKAYFCGPGVVREVSIPAAMSTVLEAVNPPWTYGSAYSGSLSIPNFVGLDDLADTSTYFYDDTYAVVTWSPSVYGSLNALSQFVDPAQIKAAPVNTKPLLTDTREGAFANSTSDRSAYYAEWLGSPEAVDLEEVQQYKRLPGPYQQVPTDVAGILNAFWDWNDANYCRQMLFALGFSSTDLVP